MPRSIAKDHADKRQAILKTAAKVFASEGYDRAAMSSVAAACGMSKANIYHYYPSKDALLFDILDSHLRTLSDRITGLTFPTNDPGEQLGRIIAELLWAYDGADAEHALQLAALPTLPPEKQDALRGHQRTLVRHVRDRIERLVPPALRQDHETLRDLTMSVFALVNWHYQWDGRANTARRAAYAQLLAKMVLDGVKRLT